MAAKPRPMAIGHPTYDRLLESNPALMNDTHY